MAVRNCFKCGREFDGETRVCKDCRADNKPKRACQINPKLSFRERQVATLVCAAKLNKEIAYELHLTEGTIKEYLNRIYRKLKLTSRTGLVAWSYQSGLVSLSKPSAKVITITPEGVAKLG